MPRSRIRRGIGSAIRPVIAANKREICGSIVTSCSPHCPLGQLNTRSAAITTKNPQATINIRPRTWLFGCGTGVSGCSSIGVVSLGQIVRIVVYVKAFALEQSQAGCVVRFDEGGNDS